MWWTVPAHDWQLSKLIAKHKLVNYNDKSYFHILTYLLCHWCFHHIPFQFHIYPNSKIHGPNMGPTKVLSAPDGPHVGLMNLVIWVVKVSLCCMMTSSNGNIFRVTGPLCGEFTGPGEFPTQRTGTRSFDVFFHLRLNKRLSKQPRGWWFETPPWALWRQCNGQDNLASQYDNPPPPAQKCNLHIRREYSIMFYRFHVWCIM